MLWIIHGQLRNRNEQVIEWIMKVRTGLMGRRKHNQNPRKSLSPCVPNHNETPSGFCGPILDQIQINLDNGLV